MYGTLNLPEIDTRSLRSSLKMFQSADKCCSAYMSDIFCYLQPRPWIRLAAQMTLVMVIQPIQQVP